MITGCICSFDYARLHETRTVDTSAKIACDNSEISPSLINRLLLYTTTYISVKFWRETGCGATVILTIGAVATCEIAPDPA